MLYLANYGYNINTYIILLLTFKMYVYKINQTEADLCRFCRTETRQFMC